MLDQEGRFDVVPSWSAQASDETTKGTGPERGAAQLVWTLPDEADQQALVVRPPDPLPLPELAAEVSGLLIGSFHSFSRSIW